MAGGKPLPPTFFRRGSAAPTGGVALAVFGLPFLAAGVGITWYAVRRHLAGAPAQDAPWWVVGAAGLCFGGAGFGMLVSGLGGALRRVVHERRLLRSLDAPWRADFRWNRREAPRSDKPHSLAYRVAASLWFLVVAAGFLAPFHFWASQTQEAGSFVALLFVAGCDLVLIAALVWGAVSVVLHGLRYGRPRLLFERFPFFVGEEVAVRFVAPRALRKCRTLSFTLRLVEEGGAGGGDGQAAAARELYADVQTFGPEVKDLVEDGALPLRFRIPADAGATWLGHDPPRYWDLEVKGEAPGLDLHRRFLVPVYERRGASG